MARTRLLLVADSRSGLSVELCRSAVALARTRRDVVPVAVCDTARSGRPGMRMLAAEAAAALVKPLFGARHPPRRVLLLARGLPEPVVRPPAGDPNDPRFLWQLENALQVDASLWLGSVAVARPELLRVLRRSVNYHNGELPRFRGLAATAWSVYEEQPTSGFSFHLMDAGIDTGALLAVGEVRVPAGARAWEVEQAKTAAAVAVLPAVLDAIVAGEGGTQQAGTARTFGRSELARTLEVPDPAALSWDELERRLRAFGRLWLTLPAGRVETTALRRLTAGRPGRAELSFVTADGVAAEATRLRFLPPTLYRASLRLDGVRKARWARRGPG